MVIHQLISSFNATGCFSSAITGKQDFEAEIGAKRLDLSDSISFGQIFRLSQSIYQCLPLFLFQPCFSLFQLDHVLQSGVVYELFNNKYPNPNVQDGRK